MTTLTVARTPHRRATAMSLVGFAVLAWAYASLARPWYKMVISAPAATLPGSLNTTGAIRAESVLNAYTLTAEGTAMTPAGPVAAMRQIGGLPTVMVMLLLVAVLLVATAVLRNGLFAVAAAAVVVYTRNQLGLTRSLVENPVYGGQYMSPEAGLYHFNLAVLVLVGLTVLIGAQVAYANRSERQLRRAAGEDVPGVLDTLYSVHRGALTRAAQRAEARERTTTPAGR